MKLFIKLIYCYTDVLWSGRNKNTYIEGFFLCCSFWWKVRCHKDLFLVNCFFFLINYQSINPLHQNAPICCRDSHILHSSDIEIKCKTPDGMHTQCAHINTVMPRLVKQTACVAEHVDRVHWEMSLCGDRMLAMSGGKQMALLCVHRHGWTNSAYGSNTPRR